MSKFTDSPEQAAVIQAPSYADVVVVAGAGSGKTYTMTRRIINLIEQGISPEKILGLTFTRKAASELLSRVSAAVVNNQKGHAAMFLKPEISTYDAFFQTIVRQYGLLVGFDQNTQPLSEAGAMQLIHTVLDKHMDEIMGFDGDLQAFSTLAGKVYKLSNAISGAMIGGGCTSFDEAVERVRAWDEAFVAQVDKALEGDEIPDNKPVPKLTKRKKKESDEDFEARERQYREECRALCVYNANQLSKVARKRDLLLNLVADYNAEKRANNMAEFSDFTIAAFQLVTRFPSIGATYRKRYTHVLLDEYQDTSTTQAALLTALFHVDSARRSAVNAVGDPFQSIYAWRGASPGAFRMLQHDFGMSQTDKPFALSVTRRNSRLVLEAANNLTKPLRLPARRRSSSLMREVDVPALSNIETASEGTLGVLGYTTRGQEIDAVVRFAKHAIALHTPSEERQTNGAKDNRPHVAVLFRSKTIMPEYENALQQAGLTVLTVGQSALLERPEIQDILALLHVVCDHTDSKSLMRLLATPRFGVKAADLQALADIAERMNTAQRYRALVAAGIIPEQSGKTVDDSEIRAIVREYRDQVPNAVFLIDVMLREDLPKLIAGKLSDEGCRAVLNAARTLRQTQAVYGHPLTEIVQTAIRALNLDIDLPLAERMRNPESRFDAALAKSPIDSMMKLVDTYLKEIAAQGAPSLRAFMSWVDSLRGASEENAVAPDTPVDVVLMTVHQSKGLEWDAVAMVEMRKNTFPSNQGDNLTVALDEDHLNGLNNGEWTPPEYFQTAKTWLDNPAAVPVPVRVDADILPRFPHDALVGVNPVETLESLDDAEVIDDEVYGTLRSAQIAEMEGVDSSSLYLTQQEEYGRRLHADERRLAYVALTRARHEVLLTYSASNDMSRDPRVLAGAKKENPSNFWNEVHDSMNGIVSVAREPENLLASDGDYETLFSIDVPLPEGYFVGEHARDFENAVVGDAWNAPLESTETNAGLPWPCDLIGRLERTFDESASQVRSAIERGEDTSEGSAGGLPAAGSLLMRARLLVADEHLMPDTGDGSGDFDAIVKAKGEKILASGRQSVTSLQARAGVMSERAAREYWRGLVRPIPHVASPNAQLGTQFHAWAERFIMAETDVSDGEIGLNTMSRAGMIADMSADESRLANGEADGRAAQERELLVWKRRLAQSVWAKRNPAWAERQLVVDVPQLGTIVNGKLDAVFFGGLNPEDSAKTYTIVDWKTGRKPRKQSEINEKLAQLDMYRILLSAMEGIPLDSIDGCLYYLSEAEEADRVLQAADKTEEEILAELSYGIPEQSDND